MTESLPTLDPVAGTNSADSNLGIERATKKVRTRSDLPPEADDPTVDRNGQKLMSDNAKPSYKSTLIGESSGIHQTDFREEDFSLLEGDAVTERIVGVPYITFSDLVQNYIQRRMSRVVIVKLLGGRIGFNTLLNKILQIWNPTGKFQLYGSRE